MRTVEDLEKWLHDVCTEVDAELLQQSTVRPAVSLFSVLLRESSQQHLSVLPQRNIMQLLGYGGLRCRYDIAQKTIDLNNDAHC